MKCSVVKKHSSCKRKKNSFQLKLKQASIENISTQRDKKYTACISLMRRKFRVASMRHPSITRLEAAVMASRLKEKGVKEHEMELYRFSFWPYSISA